MAAVGYMYHIYNHSSSKLIHRIPVFLSNLSKEKYSFSTILKIGFVYISESTWPNEAGFIVNNATTFSLFSVLSVNGRRGQISHLNVPSSVIETFAVDTNAHVIYYVDSKNRKLKEFNTINKRIRQLASISSAKGK
jgi:hypothetical protein